MTFETAVEFILKHEGGLSDDAQDSGGLTKWGISQRAYPDLDIRNLTREAAIQLYKTDYWDKCRCSELPHGLDLLVMDSAVNQGPAAAIRMLQRAVKTKVDGIIGPTTISVTTAAGKAGIVAYAARRMYQYGLHPKFSHFGNGWSQRLMECLAIALE